VEHPVLRNLEEPGREPRAVGEAGQPLVDPQEDFLRQILGEAPVTDECLGVVVDATHAAGGVCLVTADHGNAEQMLEPDGRSPHTAHTSNPVPLVLTSAESCLVEGGGLADLAPTALRLLGLRIPVEMSGQDLARAPRKNTSIR
nr:hypothetical protein [Actinomycetota bacterium]